MLSIRDLELSYRERKVFDGFDLDVADGEVLCLLGASGCGKTSLLNCIAGALQYRGDIRGAERGVAYLFQEPRLVPALTARQNVVFAVSHLWQDKSALDAKIDEAFARLGIDGLQDRYPGKMSGGQAARVALARAFCHPSDVLLMDEPFGSLDIAVKMSLVDYISDMLAASPRTVVMVSHGIEECFALADKIVVLGGDPCRILAKTEIEEPRSDREHIADKDVKTRLIKDALLSNASD